MGIDFKKTFGVQSNNVQSDKADRPKAQLWLNIGYDSGVQDKDTGETRFVSLPTGIPLDTQELLPTNSRNKEFAAFQSARNNLLAQIMEVAKELEAGEHRVLNLQIQLRRVNGDSEEIPVDTNPYAAALDL